MDKTKIIFCNICWMKSYSGAHDGDRPMRNKEYLIEGAVCGEAFNFEDHDGKCYGFAPADNRAALQNVHSGDGYTVLWCAEDPTGKNKLVGWYKNATVYNELQEQVAYTNDEYSLYYNFVANSEDCFLLPENERTIILNTLWVNHDAEAATKAVELVQHYTGKCANYRLTDELAYATTNDDSIKNNFDKLVKLGEEALDKQYFVAAITYFNTALKIKQDTTVMFYIAECYRTLNSFSRAIPLYEKCVEIDGDSLAAVMSLACMYDFIGNREKTLVYLERSIPFAGKANSEKDMDFCKVIFTRVCRICHVTGNINPAKRVAIAIHGITNSQDTNQYVTSMLNMLEKKLANPESA